MTRRSALDAAALLGLCLLPAFVPLGIVPAVAGPTQGAITP
ncbi:hypothetical protein ACQPYK_37385 [Streptosporangium sp. CA-135522]